MIIIEVCEIIIQRANDVPNFILNVCFGNAAGILLNGFINKLNCIYCDNTNQFVFREKQTQYPQKRMGRNLGNKMIGLIFMEENLTGHLYLDSVENVLNPLLITESSKKQIDQNGRV